MTAADISVDFIVVKSNAANLADKVLNKELNIYFLHNMYECQIAHLIKS